MAGKRKKPTASARGSAADAAPAKRALSAADADPPPPYSVPVSDQSSSRSPLPPPAAARRAGPASSPPRKLPAGGINKESASAYYGSLSALHANEHSNLSASLFSGQPRAPDAIDDAMNEVDHLLQAAGEAQAMGRLRNSYSSLLLAHQRLMGVGRRVDRSYCEAEGDSADAIKKAKGDPDASNLSMGSRQISFLPPLVAQPPIPHNMTHDYSDVAYTEHLARSAMELHHRRTGRGMQHDVALERTKQQERQKKKEAENLKEAQGILVGMKQGKTQVEAEDDTPAKRKGGRGKKPPTLVMHTVAGKNYDVKDVLRGIL
ncbi:hypothetical protein ACHAXT_002299 [Thalassiosira profunda]